MAQVDHGLGRALGRQQMPVRRSGREHARHRQDFRRQAVLEFGRPFGVHMLGAFEPAMAEGLDRLLHALFHFLKNDLLHDLTLRQLFPQPPRR